MATNELRSRRYLSLDHWRGLACLAVLLNHSVWYRTGSAAERLLADVSLRLWIGVPVFFVISGYCISAAADAHRERAGRPLRTFFARRLRRIYPPYWFVLIATMAIVAVVDVAIEGRPLTLHGRFLRPWWYDARQWFGNLTLTEMWRFHVIPGQKAMILGHAWTLCYEEQFYAIAGILLWLTPRRLFLGALGVSAAVGAILIVTAQTHWNVEGFFFDGSWFEFWFGMMLYYALNYGTRRVRAATLLLFTAVAIAAASDPQLLLAVEKNPTQATFVASVFAAVALVLRRFDTALFEARPLKFFRWCGLMCYSLYLVHLPVAKLLQAGFLRFGMEPAPFASVLVSVPVCLGVAWLFHLKVERRFLNSPVPASAAPRSVKTLTVAAST